jgi:hypothetical protein
MIDFYAQPLRHPGIAGMATCLLLLLVAAPSPAGQITALNWFSGIASVAADPIPPLMAPNNNDVAGPSPNQLLVTQKNYVGIGPVDLEFTVTPSGGVTEYVINEGVANSTGIPWNGYRLELGFGVGPGFMLSPSGDDLDFDAPDFNSGTQFSAFFPTWVETEDVITASGGIFPNGGFTTPLFRFSVDVPDGISAFTIRQIPIPVPEPTTTALLGIGLTSCLVRRRQRG